MLQLGLWVEGVVRVGVGQVNKLDVIIFGVAISCLICDSQQQSQWLRFLKTRVCYLQQQHRVANECFYHYLLTALIILVNVIRYHHHTVSPVLE